MKLFFPALPRLCTLAISIVAAAVPLASQAAAPQQAPAAARAQRAPAASRAASGTVSFGRVSSARPMPHGMELRSGTAVVRVTAAGPDMVRIRASSNGVFGADQSWAVVPEAAAHGAKAEFQDSAAAASITTGQVTVRVEKASGRFAFLAGGKVITEDPPARTMTWQSDAFTVSRALPEDEHIFGLGDKAGPMDRRNLAFTNWNTDAFGWQESTDPLYKTIPFFIGMRGGAAYGLFLDNTWRSFFDFGKQSRDFLSFGADGGELNYYFFYGPDPKKVLEQYSWLTGRMPLPPLYTLGYQQCRYSYFPEARVREIAQTFRQKQIPADVIYLDIDYQKGNAPFTIDRDKFPNFEGMVRDLHAANWRVIAITDLHLKKEVGYKPYDSGLAGDHLVKNPDGSVYVGEVWPGPSVFPDFTLASARDWWGTLYKEFIDMGVDGFWNDMNEPAIFLRADKTMPLDTRHRLDGGRTTTHREAHNIVGMQNVRATHDGVIKLRPNVRPFVLTRAAFAGTQRWAASWTGDNTSSWNHMRMSVPNLLSLGVSGYPNMGVDIGGFWGSPDPDLLTRWIALGAFNPIFRNHTEKGSKDQEPWVHGPEHEAIRKHFIELRYRLMPYTYTIAEEATRNGLPMMRPMFLEYPREEALATNGDQFLYGRDLLVAPKVWEQLETYSVLLPRGLWYDYWTGAAVQADGKPIMVTPKLKDLPIYARAGAIIPHQPVVQSTAEKPQGPLELRVYPGTDCRGSLYHDDGATFDYQKGEFLRISFTCEASDSGVTVRMKPEGNFAPWWSAVQVTVYGAKGQAARATAGGQAVESRFDPATRSVSFTIPAAAGAQEVRVQY